MKENNFNIDIIKGIEGVIWKSIDESIHLKSIESFDKLNNFINDILLLSIKEHSLVTYTKYINIPASYIMTTNKFLKNDSSYHEIHTFCIKRILESFQYILEHKLSYSISVDYTKTNEIESIQKTNNFIYLTINSFNRFLYNNVKIQNIQDFKKSYNRFIRIENSDNRHIYSNVKIQYISSIDSELTTNDKQLLKEHYFEFRKSNEFTIHVKIGLRYWSIFLFSMKVNDLKFTKELFNTIELNISIAELVREVIHLRDKQYDGYLEWNHWDYMERESGVSYSPPDPRNWLVFGLLIDFIRNGITDLHYQQYSYQEKKGLGDLFRSFVDKINIFRINFENWKELINCESLEILEDKILPINSFFENIEQDANIQKITKIASEKLDLSKVENFEESIKSNIKKDSLFLNITDQNSTKIDESERIKLKQKFYVANLKEAFINDSHAISLFGTNQFLASQFSGYIDDKIIYTLNSKSKKLDSFETKLSETLLKSIEYLTQLGKKVTSVIIASDDFYNINDRLYSNKDFVQNNNPQSRFPVGKFKNIDIYLTNCRYSLGKILLWDQEVFKLHLDKLNVKISELTENEIETEYRNNKSKWNRDRNGSELSKDVSEAMIKNGINIFFSIDYNLEINNSVFLAEINNSIS